MNKDINMLQEYDNTAHLSSKASYFKQQLNKVPLEYKWIVSPIQELADKTTDDVTHKLVEGGIEIVKSDKDTSKVIQNFEVQQRRNAYQSHMNNLRSNGENFTKREVDERLDLVEKLVKAKHNNVSMSNIHDDTVCKEVSSFLNMSTYDNAANINGIEMDRRRVSILFNVQLFNYL
jgi:hypothetical protein